MADQFMAESHVAIDLEPNSAPVKLFPDVILHG